jgi:hypothetical protein
VTQHHLIVTVLTYPGKPTFPVTDPTLNALDISETVELRYGRQASGAPHNWRGDSTDPEVNKVAESIRRAAVGLPEDAPEEAVVAAYDRLAAHNTRAGLGLPDTATEAEVRAAYEELAARNTARTREFLARS